jgi:hypothetical protein
MDSPPPSPPPSPPDSSVETVETDDDYVVSYQDYYYPTSRRLFIVWAVGRASNRCISGMRHVLTLISAMARDPRGGWLSEERPRNSDE